MDGVPVGMRGQAVVGVFNDPMVGSPSTQPWARLSRHGGGATETRPDIVSQADRPVLFEGLHQDRRSHTCENAKRPHTATATTSMGMTSG